MSTPHLGDPFIKAGQLILMKSSSICFDVISEPSPDDSELSSNEFPHYGLSRTQALSSFLGFQLLKCLIWLFFFFFFGGNCWVFSETEPLLDSIYWACQAELAASLLLVSVKSKTVSCRKIGLLCFSCGVGRAVESQTCNFCNYSSKESLSAQACRALCSNFSKGKSKCQVASHPKLEQKGQMLPFSSKWSSLKYFQNIEHGLKCFT